MLTTLDALTTMSALVPSMLLLWFFHSRDVFPEPPRVLWTTFGLGVLTTLPTLAFAVPLARYLDDQFPGHPFLLGGTKAFLTAAVPEEFLKLLVLLLYSARHEEFDEPMDGVVYGVAASLGFATLENVLYVLSGGLTLGVLRALTAVPGHAFLGAIMGYFVGQARFRLGDRRNLLIAAFVVPTLLHGCYDFPLLSLSAMERHISAGPAALLISLALGALGIEMVWALSIIAALRSEQLGPEDKRVVVGEGFPWNTATPRFQSFHPLLFSASDAVQWRGWLFTTLGGVAASIGGVLCLGLLLAALLAPHGTDSPGALLLSGSCGGVLPLALGLLLFHHGLDVLNEHDRLIKARKAYPGPEVGGPPLSSEPATDR